MELERVVVMAEDEQVWEPSSDGQGSVVGVAKASVRSRLTLCRATGFGIRSLGPGAEKDSEKWGCKIPCQGGAVTPSPESRGSRAHEPQGEKLGLRLVGCGLHRILRLQACAGVPGRPPLALMIDPTVSPRQLGENKRTNSRGSTKHW